MPAVQIHTEYESIEDRTFCTGQPKALSTFFGEHTTAERRKMALDQCAQRLCTAFVTLKCRPSSIVVRTPQELPDVGLGDQALRKSLCRSVPCPECSMMACIWERGPHSGGALPHTVLALSWRLLSTHAAVSTGTSGEWCKTG